MALVLLLYMGIYLPYIRGAEGEPEDYAPNVIPVTSIGMVISFLTSIMALWGVWGWYTAPIIVVILLGLFKVQHFLPLNFFGILLHFAVYVLALLSPRWIQHEGKWHNPIQ